MVNNCNRVRETRGANDSDVQEPQTGLSADERQPLYVSSKH
jgi:hypothetical protein